MSRLPLPLTITAVLYALSAGWCAVWLPSSGDERPFFFPVTFLAVAAIPIAWGLINVQRAAFIWMYIHVGVWLAIGGATAYFVKTNAVFLYVAMAHVTLFSLPFLRRNARAPFVHGDGRGFRLGKRHDINLRSHLELEGKKRDAETMDLSERGAYVAVATEGLAVGQRVMVQIHLRDDQHIRLPAHIMSVNPDGLGAKTQGIGIQFSHLTEHDTERLLHFIAEGRRHMRTPIRVPATLMHKHQEHPCDTYDLSLSGCFLDAQDGLLQPGDHISLMLHLHDGDSVEVVGEVTWLPDEQTIGKPKGVAVEFRHLGREDAARIAARLNEAGITEE